jgi:dTDP-4-amino-4,6-dideoxygalactose transaminase
MRVPFYDIQAQYRECAPELDAVVLDVMQGGHYVMGPHHRAFEAEIAERHAMRHGIAVNSGTDALRILMDAAGIGPGDEVITTAFTFVASAETVVQTGATPVFADIEPVTYGLDAAAVEAAITPRTKAILPVHLFGQMADMQALGEVANQHDLIVLEDAAQALDSTQNGRPAGHYGLGAGFSFYVTKNLGAAGDGGMILTDDDELADRCRSMRVHGMGRERYYYDHLGYTSRLDEIQAAIMRVKLKRLTEWNARRARIAEIYREELAHMPGLPVIAPGNTMTWHQFSVRLPDRDRVKAQLADAGVDSMIYYPVPLHFHAPYARFGAGADSLPVTEAVCREIMNLPIHPHLSEAQARYVAQTLRAARAAGVA